MDGRKSHQCQLRNPIRSLYFKLNGRLLGLNWGSADTVIWGNFCPSGGEKWTWEYWGLEGSQTFLLKCRTISLPVFGFLTISAIVWRQIERSLSSLGVALRVMLLFFWRFQKKARTVSFVNNSFFPLQHLFLQTIFKELAAASIISLAVSQTNQSYHFF